MYLHGVVVSCPKHGQGSSVETDAGRGAGDDTMNSHHN